MGLSWRDAAATILVGAAVAVTLAVVNAWGWPLVADARAGAIAVLVLGFAASVTGGGPQWFIAALRREVSTQGMWLSIFASAMGLLSFVLLAVNLFANSVTLLAWTTVALLVLWVVATIHHAVEARPHVSLLAN
ncbi:MAG TPA: hypothetical protein VFL27_03450 [Candidatus Dormibacteraeota bacterium]|nr:hypothetical protein [Candidatus Dormibacteraeota bacterium]